MIQKSKHHPLIKKITRFYFIRKFIQKFIRNTKKNKFYFYSLFLFFIRFNFHFIRIHIQINFFLIWQNTAARSLNNKNVT